VRSEGAAGDDLAAVAGRQRLQDVQAHDVGQEADAAVAEGAVGPAAGVVAGVLWQQGRPPLEALRRAQLALYRDPGAVPALARGRGPDFEQTVRRVAQPPARPGARAAVKDWAAFVLSGPGW
jgi:hypothetical protein